jgi:hypothetical protein
MVAALFVAFGAFGLGSTTTSASPISPIAIGTGPCTPNAGTPGAAIPAAGVTDGTVICVRANFANTAAALSVTASGAVSGNLNLLRAQEYTSVTPTAVDVTQLAVDTDNTALVYGQGAAILSQYPVQPPPLVSLTYDLTIVASCPSSNSTFKITSAQTSAPFTQTIDTGDIPCIAPTAAKDVLTNVLSIKKVDQLGVIRGASFAIQSEAPAGSNNWVTIATVVTSGSVGSQNPCLTNTNCATNGTQYCNTGFSSNCAQVPGALPPNVAGGVTLANGNIRVVEIAQASSCTLVQISDKDGDTVIQPVLLTLPARTNDATLTFINSCQTPLGPVVANSAIAVVIGGATQGLSDSTHLEIVPAPGSDDDARVDIRVRDTNSTNSPGAHVTMSIDKGAMAMRTDTTGPGVNCTVLPDPYGLGIFAGAGAPNVNPYGGTATPNNCYNGNGYEVIEPVPGSVYFGSHYSGDTCDQDLVQQYNQATWTYNPTSKTYSPVSGYNGGVTAPFLLSGSGQLRQVQDGYTNTDGIISACVYVNSDLAPGVTPGKMNITVIVDASNTNYYPYGASNIILTASIPVVGPPASIKVAASPTSVQCGEKSTITATVTDSVGQNVSDHTRVELVSNAGATIGGTGSTLGFPGVGIANPASSSAAETFSGIATAFLLTSTEHVGPYEVVVASGGSVGGVVTTAQPGVAATTGAFSTAPVSAQVTVTCALPVTAAPAPPPIIEAPIAAPRTGEGIRPPNTGDAGLADASGSSWAFVLAGAVAFALAGIASVKFARR